jgi:hypothetical protein
MSNVLDVQEIHRLAGRIAGKIPDAKVAARLEKLLYARLFNDERNFRAARPDELAAAPGYIQAAIARGDKIQVFQPHRGAAQRLHILARRLADVCKLAKCIAADSQEVALIAATRAFLNKIDRANLDVIADKSREYARVYAQWSAMREHVCPPGQVPVGNGRVWRRVTSLVALQSVGREFGNCLARTTKTSAYGSGLVDGHSQYWVLRDANGAGLMVAMASTGEPVDFREVKAPGNAAVSRAHPDLAVLAAAILTPTHEPPTPAPPSPIALVRRRFPASVALEDIVCAPIGLDMMPLAMHVVRFPARPGLKRRKAS